MLERLFRVRNLVIVFRAWKIHPVHALLGKPPLAGEIEMGSYAIDSPVHMGYGCL